MVHPIRSAYWPLLKHASPSARVPSDPSPALFTGPIDISKTLSRYMTKNANEGEDREPPSKRQGTEEPMVRLTECLVVLGGSPLPFALCTFWVRTGGCASRRDPQQRVGLLLRLQSAQPTALPAALSSLGGALPTLPGLGGAKIAAGPGPSMLGATLASAALPSMFQPVEAAAGRAGDAALAAGMASMEREMKHLKA